MHSHGAALSKSREIEMASSVTRANEPKRTTIADMIAAAKVGALDPSTVVVEANDVYTMVNAAVENERANRAALAAATSNGAPAAPSAVLSATEHDCGIPGCRHGNAHPAVSQPDRQVKLQCPNCGAVARMTRRALGQCGGGIVCVGDGGTFAVAARRNYARKAQ